MLNVLGEFIRESLAIRAHRKLSSTDVIDVLTDLFILRNIPASLLVAPHLERGTLVRLFDPPVPAPARYFLAVAPAAAEKPTTRAIVEWIQAAAREAWGVLS